MVRVAGVSVAGGGAAALAFVAVVAALGCPPEALARPQAPAAHHQKPAGQRAGKGRGRNVRHRRHGPRLKPAAPLPVLPTLSRVELAVDSGFVIVSETIQLTRNDWEKGELRLCIGHGAPGAPKAFDAHLQTPEVAGSELVATPPSGKALPSEFAASCPVNARLVLGGPQMATSVVTISEPALRSAFEKTDRTLLHIRFLVDLPHKEADGGRELLLRLGAPEGVPITVSAIAVRARSERLAIAAAEAVLCGPQADAIALTVEGLHRALPTLQPSLAIRRPSDDLCVRYWTNAR